MEFSLCVNNWLNLALSYEFVIYRSAKFYGISPWLLKKSGIHIPKLDDVDVHKKSFFKRQNVCGGCGDAFPQKRFHKMNKK